MSPQEPLLRIIRGNPSEDEVAAITAVLLSISQEPAANVQTVSRWANRQRLLRKSIDHSRGSWRHWSA